MAEEYHMIGVGVGEQHFSKTEQHVQRPEEQIKINMCICTWMYQNTTLPFLGLMMGLHLNKPIDG